MSFVQQRRTHLMALTALLLGRQAPAMASTDYPARPVTIVLGNVVGGAVDMMARITANGLAKQLGQPVNVENRVGATGTIGAAHVVRSPADGYTLFFAGSGFTIAPAMMSLSYDPIRDFEPLGMVATVPNILVVHPSVQAGSVSELIALAKQKPNELSYVSAGPASINRMAGELFQDRAGVQLLQVPYKGTGEAMADMLSGRVHMAFDQLSSVLPHIRAGKLKPLAVTGTERVSYLPEIPTISESGLPGYSIISWFGLLAPPKTPKEVLAKLERGLQAVLETPDAQAAIRRIGAEPVTNGTAQALGDFMRADLAKWSAIVKTKGIKIQ
ncbi:MAG: Bug family tripartite tricarboxylate transporter substrate binding protein [Burkholderiaceae bacterium]